MKMSGNIYSYLIAMAVMLFFLVMTLMLGSIAAKIVPFIALGLGLTSAVIGLTRTLTAKTEAHAEKISDTAIADSKGRVGWRSYTVLLWLAVVYVLLLVFGVIIGTFLFILPFMRMHGSRWWVATVTAVCTTGIVYLLFKVALQINMYNGLFLPS